MKVSEKTKENFEQLGRQVRPGFEPGISRLPVRGQNRSATSGKYWWFFCKETKNINALETIIYI